MYKRNKYRIPLDDKNSYWNRTEKIILEHILKTKSNNNV